MADRPNRGLLDVGVSDFKELPLGDDLSWLKERVGRFVEGGIYLLAGPPGIGKSTLSIQLGLALGAQDIASVYILTEQSKQELANRARLMTASWKPRARERAFINLKPEDALYDIETLPNFLAHKVISQNGDYHGARVVRQALMARETERAGLQAAAQDYLDQRRALESPQAAQKAEIADLERQIRDLEQKIEIRRKLLFETQQRAEGLGGEVQKTRRKIGSIDAEIGRLGGETERRRKEVESAQRRLLDANVRALRLYADEIFSSLQGLEREVSPQERYQKVNAAFEAARHADTQVMHDHEKRRELKGLLEIAQVPAVRDPLHAMLRDVEKRIEERFPGLLEGPPPPEREDPVDTYFWYDQDDDLTYVLLPVPISCWKSPPETAEDPRGATLCRVLWSFVRAVGEQVPSVDLLGDLVVLELHGDHTPRLDTFIEVSLPTGRTVAFLPTELPEELREALS